MIDTLLKHYDCKLFSTKPHLMKDLVSNRNFDDLRITTQYDYVFNRSSPNERSRKQKNPDTLCVTYQS